MLHFNNLDYCAIPALPKELKAPMWLTVELGFLAGRLYFEFDEYEAIMALLGMSTHDAHGEDLNDEDIELLVYEQENNIALMNANHPFFAKRKAANAQKICRSWHRSVDRRSRKKALSLRTT
jgi:hypothetical protein